MKRWAVRIGLGVLAFAVLGVGVVTIGFLRYRAAGNARFRSVTGTVITTARGPVEYTEVGRGRPVLQIHGSPGGFDAFYWLHRTQYGDSGPPFRAILPSRPGYLRTPLSTGKTPAEQADALAALLDALNLQRVAVVGVSDGGPSAIQFALRHGDRCSALVLISAVAQQVPDVDLPPVAKVMLKVLPGDFVAYLFTHGIAGRLREKHPDDPVGLAIVDALMQAAIPFASRLTGVLNDLANDKVIGDWPLKDVRCPTLVVHGSADDAVPFAHGEKAAKEIPGARLLRLDGADHFAFIFLRDRIDAAVAAFLAAHPEVGAR